MARSCGVVARKRNQTAPNSTGPPKYTLSCTWASRLMSGNRRDTEMEVGLLTMTPIGAGPRLFITSTTESAKSESGSSARAVSRIAVTRLLSAADVGHDIPNRSSTIQIAPARSARSWKALFTDDTASVRSPGSQALTRSLRRGAGARAEERLAAFKFVRCNGAVQGCRASARE